MNETLIAFSIYDFDTIIVIYVCATNYADWFLQSCTRIVFNKLLKLSFAHVKLYIQVITLCLNLVTFHIVLSYIISINIPPSIM